jgi:hypothetical protein
MRLRATLLPRKTIPARQTRKMESHILLIFNNLQKRCSKKRAFSQKNGGRRPKKRSFRNALSTFSRILILQGTLPQRHPILPPHQEKSCRKTYGRFSSLRRFWHNFQVNVQYCSERKAARFGRAAAKVVSTKSTRKGHA